MIRAQKYKILYKQNALLYTSMHWNRFCIVLLWCIHVGAFTVRMQETTKLAPRPTIKYNTHVPPRRPLFTPCVLHSHTSERISSLEALVSELCIALIDCDDLKLLERETAKIGPIFMDTGFAMSRRPMLLRSRVRDIVQRYNTGDVHLERKWNVYNTSSSFGT